MNEAAFQLAKGLVPVSYVQQAQQARQARESLVKTLLAQRRLPEKGWDEVSLRLLLAELAGLDSNTFVGNAGVGEREGRVVCPIISQRHFGLGHGIGRSGDIAEAQPKAAGSSLIYALTNALAADALKRAGATGISEAVTLPLATGMSVTLLLLALRQLRPNATYVLWPRIDQKSCLKAICAAGLTPLPIENVLEGDELRTDVPALAAKTAEVGADRVLCVLSTTSCFAPRGIEKLLEVARLCHEVDIPHIVNNAYGVQCSACMKAIATASRHARLDAFVQSTDKNFLVPVGGAIVATASKEYGSQLLAKLRSTYPGRASISPVLDLFTTLLYLGASGWTALLERRRAMLPPFRKRLAEVAAKHGERLLETPHNEISMAVSLKAPVGSKPVSTLGANLFIRLVSGVRVVVSNTAMKTVGGCTFTSCVPRPAILQKLCASLDSSPHGLRVAYRQATTSSYSCRYGAHCNQYPTTYFSVACAVGISQTDVDLFLKRLDKALGEWKKAPTIRPRPPPTHATNSPFASHEQGDVTHAIEEEQQQ